MVIAGKDKGKSGTVLAAFPKDERVLVEGVNLQTKHQKNRRVRSQGQVVEKGATVHVSNVALVENKKPVRAGYAHKDDKKVRISRASQKEI